MSYRSEMLAKKRIAQRLRGSGQSIKSIERELKISRSTASRWCRDIELTQTQENRLYRNQKTGALRGSRVAAKNKKEAKARRLARVREQAQQEYGSFENRDRFVGGVALYAGEGAKTGTTVQFANTDPKLVLLMMEWFRRDCGVQEARFRGSVYIHDDLDEAKAVRYWSRLTGIPQSQFTKSYIAVNRKGGLRKRRHAYGVFRITVADINLLCKIKTWIELFTSKNIPG